MTRHPENGILSSLNVKSKIALGFAIVLVLHVTIAALSHFGMDRSRENLATYDRYRREADRISEIDMCVRDLQRLVMLYTHTGHESARNRAIEVYGDLRGLVESARKEARDQDQTDYFSKMLAHLKLHNEIFDAVTVDRAKRKSLFDDTLRGLYASAHASIDNLKRVPGTDPQLVSDIDTALYQADANVFRYVLSPDSGLVGDFKRRLQEAREAVSRAAQPGGDVDHSAVATDTIRLLYEYEKTFIHMVQATRGYLHLVNVVMAGEAAEFIRLSNAHRLQVDRDVGALGKNMAQSAVDFQWISNAFSIATILLGVLAAMWISRDVAPPLNEITETLEGLAKGKPCNVIPGVGRGDEVGRLAAAAEVFKQRAQEIESLYVESQSARNELSRYTKELERRNQELDEFTHVASHDLQEPLRKLVAFSTLLPQHIEVEISEQATRDLFFISDSATRMKRLVQALLELSRTGKSDMKSELVDLKDVVRDACDALSESIREKNAVIRQDDLPTVTGDARLLTQLYQNLIGNALKFVRPGEAPEIRLTAQRNAGKTVLGVRDNGIGIKAQYLDQVFAPFKRLHARDEFAGSGIGLSICRKVIDRHDGKLWIESEYGRGSHFQFLLGDGSELQSCTESYPAALELSC